VSVLAVWAGELSVRGMSSRRRKLPIEGQGHTHKGTRGVLSRLAGSGFLKGAGTCWGHACENLL
jgi:hypothetical protein